VARHAWLATQGGLSVELCAVMCHVSPMALSRPVCALGHQSLGSVLPRCGLPRPTYFLADEKPSHGLTDRGYRPTIVRGWIICHLGSTEEASTAALTQSYGVFQRVAFQQEPAYRVRGILTEGFDSPHTRLRTLFPGTRLGTCGRHAVIKRPGTLAAMASPVRRAWRSRFHALLSRARQRQGWRIVALGQRLRHVAEHVAATAGTANGARVRRWFQEQKAGWYAGLADPQLPVTSPRRDQAPNAIARKLFRMQGFHPTGGSPRALLTGLAHLYNLVPYQRRAQHAGPCGGGSRRR
jgi:hypothetical protein